MRLLAVDAGFRSMGLCHADYDPVTGVVEPVMITLVETDKASSKTVRRSSDDFRRACELSMALRDASQGSDVVFCEIPSGSQSARASWALGIALGCLTVIEKPLFQVTPQQTKMVSIGRKDATKEEIIAWANGKYPGLEWIRGKGNRKGMLSPRNEHIADAVAIVHAGLLLPEFRQVLAMSAKLTHA